MPSPYLKLENITKKFGDFTALKDISLEIYESEFLCFLGPSGCGKTTLLRVIAGLDIQTAGRVEQMGEDISTLSPSERDFGIVFQSYALFPNLTVYKNVAFGLENQKMSAAKVSARVDELLNLVGLVGQGKKYPAQLSGGEQQRVALSRALATSPGLLLLDEPLSALDAKVRERLRQEVKELQNKLGITTIMVTHDQEEALTMADRIVVMNQGAIEQIGTPLEIYRQPTNPFVADFIGSMNFLPAVVASSGKVLLGAIELLVGQGLERLELNEGSPVTISVRPENIVARGVKAGTPNAFEVMVLDLLFLGPFFRARLSPVGTENNVFRADFSVNLVNDIGIERGKNLFIAFPHQKIRLFTSL